MTGLLLLIVAALWLLFVIWLSKRLTRKLSTTAWHIPVVILISAILLPLPLIDEIVGGWQFSKLCKDHQMIQVDRGKIRGATIYYEPINSINIKNLWLLIRLQPWQHFYTNGELAMRYDSLYAKGGWLIRTLGISEGDAPLLFRGSCFPKENPVTLMKSLNVTTLDRPR